MTKKKITLQNQFNEFKRLEEGQQSNINERLFKTLNDTERFVCSLCPETQTLNAVNKYQAKYLKKLLQNEQKLNADIEKLETSKKNLEKELSNVKVSIIMFNTFEV